MNLDDVDAFAIALADVEVGLKWNRRTWMVGNKGFAWHRPLTKADLKRLGDTPPPVGDLLAVSVESLDAKDALLAIAPPGFFTISHFDGYAAILIELRLARAADVRAAVRDAWRVVAAKQPARRATKTPSRAAKNPARVAKKPPARGTKPATRRPKKRVRGHDR